MACFMNWALCVMLYRPCGWFGTASSPLKAALRIYNPARVRFFAIPCLQQRETQTEEPGFDFLYLKNELSVFPTPQYYQVSAH